MVQYTEWRSISDGSIISDIPDSGLVHEFLFDEGSGTSFADTAGNADGSLNGATWQSGAGAGDYYIDTDGGDDTPRTDSNISISGTQDRTFVAWINYHEEGNYIWEYANNDSDGGRMAVRFQNGDEFYHSMHFENATITGIDYSSVLDSWGMIAHRTQNGDTLKVDVEPGTSNESSGSVSNSAWDTNTDDFKFGWHTVGGTDHTDVDFGEMYVYDRHLSDSELSDIRYATADNYPV